MSGSHEKLPRLFWVQIVAVLVIGVLYLFAPSPKGTTEAKVVDPQMVAALKPIGAVEIKVDVAAMPARSGEEIVKGVCAVCHSIGLANAPKLDASAKADWVARLNGDMDALVTSAINGKGGMPPRGGDPSITDEEITASIMHMLSLADVEVADTAAAPAETPAAAAVVAEPVVTTPEVAKPNIPEVSVESVVATAEGEKVYQASCMACHANGVANAPILGDKLAWAPRLEQGMSVLYTTALMGDSSKAAMPVKGGNPSLSDEAVIEAINYMVVKSK